MKTRVSLACVLTVTLGVMPFAGGCAQTAAQSTAITNSVETKSAPPALTTTAQSPVIEEAPARPVVKSTGPPAVPERPVPVKPAIEESAPANLKISPALREVIKMAKAGVGKDVLNAFVGESKEHFALGPDEIIYLNDLGVADEVTTAMIERDQVLRADTATGVTAAPQPVATPEPTLPTTDSTLYAPQYQTPVSAAAPAVAPQPEPVQTVASTESDAAYFYDSLSPYGNWVSVPNYGLCWQPTVAVSAPGWRPYLDGGHWVWSDSGWYWLSDYSWGWAPFHYGRWFYHGHHGWVWHPGRVWGPAWVSWRNSDAYCGWAPLPPEAGYVTGVGLTWYGSGVAMDFEFGLGWSSYSFVPVASLCDYYPRHHIVHHDKGHDCWKHSKVVNKIKVKGDNNTVIVDADGRTRVKVNGDDNNVAVDGHGRTKVKIKGDDNTVVFEGGADPRRVETASSQPVRRVSVRDAAGEPAPGRRGERIEREGSDLVVYRPELPSRVSERTRSAVARVAAQSDRNPERTIRVEGVRNERSPEGLRAVDARSNRADSRPPVSVAVAPPVAAPVVEPARSSSTGRVAGGVRSRQDSVAAADAVSDAGRERLSPSRTPESRVSQRNNTSPVRSAASSPAVQVNTPKPAPSIPANVAPTAYVDRSRTSSRSSVEATVRPNDARSVRTAPTANVSRTATPTPVTRATPIMNPYQIEYVEPIRVWNPPQAASIPQPSQPVQPSQTSHSVQPNPPVQPNVNRNGNPVPNVPFRNYTPSATGTPSPENNRPARSSGAYDSRAARAQSYSGPAYQAPVPSYSAPERSRSESVRSERSSGGDNSVRSSGGGGGSGSGGRNAGNDGGNSRSPGRNR